MFGKMRCGELQPSQFDVFNLAPDGATSVRFIAAELLRQLGFSDKTKISYGESTQGWPGDVAQSRMDSSKLRAAGFPMPRSSDEALCHAIRQILQWLPSRTSASDDLRLPADARLTS
jgi:hypothetical protein